MILVTVENCTVEDLDSNYGANYYCGPGGEQTEVRIVERNLNREVLWSYVVRPGGIMCEYFGLYSRF